MNSVSTDLLAWYDKHARDLPWRYKPGDVADPYRVWLSEVMLQQTTVATVKSYFKKFTQRWPSVGDLAAASQEEVLAQWAGLGYYARARNLHACAQTIVSDWGGVFPTTQPELLTLPGVGDYSSAAIAAIAFGQADTVVDGNVERLISRLKKLEEPLPKSRPQIKREATVLTPNERAGDYAQAMMDLGSGICTPKSPSCMICPLQRHCLGFAHYGEDRIAQLPRKLVKAPKPTRSALVYWIEDQQGRIFLRRRPQTGLLAGMLELPSSEWLEDGPDTLPICPFDLKVQPTGLRIKHTFTHFHLWLEIGGATCNEPMALSNQADAQWLYPDQALEAGLPTLMTKVIKAKLA